MENMEKEFTIPKWAENTTNASKKFQPKMSAQAQKFEIFEKSSLWVPVVREPAQRIYDCSRRRAKSYYENPVSKTIK